MSSYGAFSDFYNTDYLTHFSPTVISMIGAIQIFLFYLCTCRRSPLVEYSRINCINVAQSVACLGRFSMLMDRASSFQSAGLSASLPCSCCRSRNQSKFTSNICLRVSCTPLALRWGMNRRRESFCSVLTSSRFFPAANVITHWFRRRVAYALGCVIAGSGVGGIVFPIMLTRLIPRIGFGRSFTRFRRCTISNLL